MRKMVTLIPNGGLGNRMQTIASFIAFGKRNNLRLNIVWFRDHTLNCPFSTLFELPDEEGVSVSDAGIKDYLLHDFPRRGNLYLPALVHKILYTDRIYLDEFVSIQKRPDLHEPFLTRLKDADRTYLVACRSIYAEPFMLNVLRPTQRVRQRTAEIAGRFTPNTVGIHIRRTDHKQAVLTSPTSLYIRKMEEEIEKDPGVSFFLASDSPEEKEKMLSRYGNRIITDHKPVRRDSEEGVIDALAEIYALSATRKIYASAYSTFALVAAGISGRPGEFFN